MLAIRFCARLLAPIQVRRSRWHPGSDLYRRDRARRDRYVNFDIVWGPFPIPTRFSAQLYPTRHAPYDNMVCPYLLDADLGALAIPDYPRGGPPIMRSD